MVDNMFERDFSFKNGKGGAALAIRVIPRAKQNAITQVLEDGTVKVRLTSPPVEGKANIALMKFLSNVLDIPQSNIEIVAGKRSRKKLVSILEMEPEEVQKRILQYMT